MNFYFNKSKIEYENAIKFMYAEDKKHQIAAYIKSYEDIDKYRKVNSFELDELRLLKMHAG